MEQKAIRVQSSSSLLILEVEPAEVGPADAGVLITDWIEVAVGLAIVVVVMAGGYVTVTMARFLSCKNLVASCCKRINSAPLSNNFDLTISVKVNREGV